MKGALKLQTSNFLDKIQNYEKNGVFYMPSFGPVYYKKEKINKFVAEVLGYWENKIFLDYDKGKRWFEKKEEYICLPCITFDHSELYIPVINTKGESTLKIFLYFKGSFSAKLIEKAKKLAEKVSSRIKFSKTSVIVFKDPGDKREVRKIYLKKIDKTDRLMSQRAQTFENLPSSKKMSFALLGAEKELSGSHMLWRKYLSKNRSISKIFVVADDARILGMIGPMNTLKDAWGKLQLMPPYFEVSKLARRKKIGSELWKAAINWGLEQDVEYLLIQAKENDASDYFYQKAGLLPCGKLYEVLI